MEMRSITREPFQLVDVKIQYNMERVFEFLLIGMLKMLHSRKIG
jgi:hypothetical protein